ncbi:MAG: hypothetical protein LC796_16140 [Acidobacteria bacterium]|nr:hypothetical protein [Acidobacteriota bacterium]MCA1611926.1 hypothetical protein [Acidobacteriota bacterium]
MSVEKIQLLHEDYIRLTERFKALWTFHQFVRGVYKTFFSADAGYTVDFTALYENVKTIASRINTGSPETVDPLLKDLNSRLDGVARQLREVDRKISPSFMRRFFERVRPQDEKIAFYLLRFYFSQPDIDEDVIDKVDFLATLAATGQADPEASATRPRSQIRKFFESLTSSSIWPRMDSAMTPAIVRAFDELATDVASAREFEELLNQRLLENVRTMKRRVANGLSNAEILTAVAWCNLTSRSVFHRLYEREERRLDEATGRITNLERELTRGGGETAPPEEFQRFRDSRIKFDRQAMDHNVRAQHVMELKNAIGDVLTKFDISGLAAEDIDQALELVEEIEPEGSDENFWRPCLDRVLAAVELYDDGVGPLRTNVAGLAHLNLESWELAAARRAVTQGAPASASDRTLLCATALRFKAETEAAALGSSEAGPPAAELMKAARATIARSPQIDLALSELVESLPRGTEARSWSRTRFRLLRSTSDLWLSLDAAEVAGDAGASENEPSEESR